jgi:hypothetical protein
MGDIETSAENAIVRAKEYLKIYRSFASAVKRVSADLQIGNSIACTFSFLDCFLKGVTEEKLPIDFVSLHTYGTSPRRIRDEGEHFDADAIYAKLAAEARGNYEILKAKGEGYQQIIAACTNDANAAAQMLLIEKLQELVALQTEAIKNIKIDKVTVWDSGQNADGQNSTAGFISGMMKAVPPLNELFKQAGMELPDLLGKDITAEPIEETPEFVETVTTEE